MQLPVPRLACQLRALCWLALFSINETLVLTVKRIGGNLTGQLTCGQKVDTPDGLVSFAATTSGPAPAAAALTATPPAAMSMPKSTKTRGADRKPRRRGRVTTEVDVANVAALYAAGVSKTKIVRVMDLAKSAINEILARPDVQEYAESLRRAIRVETQTRLQQLTGKLFDWLDEVAASRDSKAFDNLTRSLAAMERVSASTSGEATKTQAEITVVDRGQLSAEANELVQALLASGASVAK